MSAPSAAYPAAALRRHRPQLYRSVSQALTEDPLTMSCDARVETHPVWIADTPTVAAVAVPQETDDAASTADDNDAAIDQALRDFLLETFRSHALRSNVAVPDDLEARVETMLQDAETVARVTELKRRADARRQTAASDAQADTASTNTVTPQVTVEDVSESEDQQQQGNNEDAPQGDAESLPLEHEAEPEVEEVQEGVHVELATEVKSEAVQGEMEVQEEFVQSEPTAAPEVNVVQAAEATVEAETPLVPQAASPTETYAEPVQEAKTESVVMEADAKAEPKPDPVEPVQVAEASTSEGANESVKEAAQPIVQVERSTEATDAAAPAVEAVQAVESEKAEDAVEADEATASNQQLQVQVEPAEPAEPADDASDPLHSQADKESERVAEESAHVDSTPAAAEAAAVLQEEEEQKTDNDISSFGYALIALPSYSLDIFEIDHAHPLPEHDTAPSSQYAFIVRPRDVVSFEREERRYDRATRRPVERRLAGIELDADADARIFFVYGGSSDGQYHIARLNEHNRIERVYDIGQLHLVADLAEIERKVVWKRSSDDASTSSWVPMWTA